MASTWTSPISKKRKVTIKFVFPSKRLSPLSTNNQNMTAQTLSTINPLVNTKSPHWLMPNHSQITGTPSTITN